jgi:lysozyme
MHINQTGLLLIADYEDFRPKPYDDGTGTITIGYGHTRSPVMPASVTEEEAKEMLVQDVQHFEQAVKRELLVAVNRNQFSALVSLTYNIGEGAFRNSTLLKKLNNQNFEAASNEFEKWTQGGGKELKGLVRRRAAERQLFMTQPMMHVHQEMMQGPEFVASAIVNVETGVVPEVPINPAINEAALLVTYATIEVYDPTVETESDDETTEEGTEATGPTGIVS